MRFGQKIFLISFVLIIIIINVVGIIMINYTYEINMQKEIDKNMVQINNVERALRNNFDDFSNIASTYLKNNLNIEVLIDNKTSYTNFKNEYSELAKEVFKIQDNNDDNEYDSSENEENIKYQPIGDKVELYIQKDRLFMKLEKDDEIIITLSNISEINRMKQSQTEFFIKLSLVSSFIVSLILSISVKLVTYKIKILDRAVKRVQKGDYSIKVKKLGNDEVGNFADNFNNMTNAIQKNISEIQEVSENRKKFICNLTHEIRTPLTSIVGYSSLIKNRKIDDNNTIIEYSNRIYEEGKYIEQMSEKLMDMFMVKNSKINMEKLNISEELLNIINELKQIYPNVIYEYNIQDNVYTYYEKILFKSLILNLVKNAIKAYEKNPLVRIELSEKQIRIIDYGKGIKEEEIEKVKEPFYTLSKDRNREFSGMGLGLPLCIKIVEQHNWKLDIKSKENVGTIIIIKLGEESEKKN